MVIDLFDGEFEILLRKDHRLDETEQHFRDEFFGQQFGETEMNKIDVGDFA